MAIDKKPLAFFIYLFGLFIFSIRGKHNNSFKTWISGAAQQASHARKFLLSELPPSDRQDCSLPEGKGREPSWRWLSQGQRRAWDTTSGSARPWLSKWHLRGCCALPWTGKKLVYAGFQYCRMAMCVLWPWRGNGCSTKPERCPLLLTWRPKPFRSFP